MAVTITHTTPADGTFSATGAAAWDANHAVSGLGTMAEQNANNVAITGGSISGVTVSGTVTSVTASSPLASSGGATPDISLSGIITGANGGTGVNNGASTITLGGNLTTSGAYNTTLTTTASTNVTLPTSGTLISSVTNMAANPVTGTPSASNYLRGDGTWASVPATSLTVGTTATSGGAAGQIMFDTGSVLQESSALTFASNTLQINGANILGGTNSFTLGGAAAASPSAQTIRAQSVVAGTTDTAGANLTITGSQSTGTGTAGTIIFQTSSRGTATGTAQNALATVATIGPNTLTGSQTTPVLSLAQTWNTTGVATALLLNVTNTASNSASLLMDLQSAGVSKTNVNYFSGTQTWNVYDPTGVTVRGRIQYATPGGRVGIQFWTDLGSANRVNIWYPQTSVFGFGYDLQGATIGVNISGNALVASTAAFGWNSAALDSGSQDLFLTRRGAANLRFGAADAAAPVAQTLSVQSVVAGTSNTAGANLTITGSQGTGTGAGGSIIFRVAPAGSSGTAQNALTTAMTITQAAGSSQTSVLLGSPSSSITSATGTAGLISSASVAQLLTAENTAAYSSVGGAFSGLYANTGSAITSGSRMGGLFFGAASSASAVRNSTIIQGFATENWVDGSAYGSRIEFGTTANTTTTRTIRLIIGNSGIITFGATEADTVPALKPSSTTLQVRLGDDSAFAPLSAASITSSANITANGATSVIGYATGSGGAVTQATSRTTGVTLNKSNGQITLVSAAGTTSWQSFTVSNTTVAATDTIHVVQASGTDLYQIFVTNVAANSFQITFATTGGTTTEQPVFNFAVIKAVAA